MITPQEVRELALTNYNKGGDEVYECWEDSQILREINDGATKIEDWLRIFDFYKEMQAEPDYMYEEAE